MRRKQQIPATDRPEKQSTIQKIYNKIFNKQNKKKMEEKRVPVAITCYSQPHVLQQRMKEAHLQHGDRVTASLNPIRLESNYGKMIMYFCPMNGINIHERLETGDRRNLPQEAIIEGITVPGTITPGLYKLKNVQLFSNGTMQVIATADTTFERV